jgi:hypothetical protein
MLLRLFVEDKFRILVSELARNNCLLRFRCRIYLCLRIQHKNLLNHCLDQILKKKKPLLHDSQLLFLLRQHRLILYFSHLLDLEWKKILLIKLARTFYKFSKRTPHKKNFVNLTLQHSRTNMKSKQLILIISVNYN